MADLLPKEVKDQIKTLLESMVKPVKMVVFTKTGDCVTCKETKQLLHEIESLNQKILVVEKNIDTDKEDVDRYHIEMAPSFVLLDDNDKYLGVKFNGIPAGHEINSFLAALLFMSGVDTGLDQKTIDRIQKIKQPVDIKVFITLSCPHCPGAVQTAHILAMMNENIQASMIESQTFMDMSRKYRVSGVPKIVINETHELLGNQPIEAFLDQLEKLN